MSHLQRSNLPPDIAQLHDEMTRSKKSLSEPVQDENANPGLAAGLTDGQTLLQCVKLLHLSDSKKPRVEGWTEHKDAELLSAWFRFLKDRACQLQASPKNHASMNHDCPL